MLTDLKVFSLRCKCVFYKPELNSKADPIELNFANLEMKHTNGWSIKKHEKNGVICLVIMSTPIVMVFKMSEITNFLYFLLITAKSFS